MKLVFVPLAFRRNKRFVAIRAVGNFRGPEVNFLGVMARLYTMPGLFFLEGVFVEVDFARAVLTLRQPEFKDEEVGHPEIVQHIPLSELCNLSFSELVDKHIRPFAAALADVFEMPRTAKAIRAGKGAKAVDRIAYAEGHKVFATEISNLLFPREWGTETPYKIEDLNSYELLGQPKLIEPRERHKRLFPLAESK
jgi:hypothetical protein